MAYDQRILGEILLSNKGVQEQVLIARVWNVFFVKVLLRPKI